MTAELYSTSNEEELEAGLSAASLAIQRGGLVVLPTDTVYGVAADAFDPEAVAELLEAKDRDRSMPPPVLISSAATVEALAVRIPGYAQALIEQFWPGPLTLILHQQMSLQWDLGDTRGTVAVRMPDHPITLALLERTGPLAVSSANISGDPAATTAEEADEMLGELVDVILDHGPSPAAVGSTIVDATSDQGRILRRGPLSIDDLNAVLEPLGATLTDES